MFIHGNKSHIIWKLSFFFGIKRILYETIEMGNVDKINNTLVLLVELQ